MNSTYVSPERLRRPSMDANAACKKARILLLTIAEKRDIKVLEAIRDRAQETLEGNLNEGCINPVAVEILRDSLAALRRLEYFDANDYHFTSYRMFPEPLSGIDQLRGFIKDDELFKHYFGVSPMMLKTMSALCIDNAHPGLRHDRKGRISSELATMVVFRRLRCTAATLVELGAFFGRAESWVSEWFHSTIRLLYKDYGCLLELGNLANFERFRELWTNAVLRKYVSLRRAQNKEVNKLPSRFKDTVIFLDCVRQFLSRPSIGQESAYNGHSKAHSITHIALCSPDGLILVCEAFPGHNNDQGAAKLKLDEALTDINMKAMSDKGFFLGDSIRPFHKVHELNQPTKSQMKSLSAIRTAGCEWPYGHLKSLFPYLDCIRKQKVFQTRPEIVFQVAVILSNLVNLSAGRQNHTFFKMDIPMTAEEYLQMADDQHTDST